MYKPLTVWTLNSEYEKVYNCRVVDPTFEKWKGLHNEQFFLDKRLWMLPYHNWDYHFTDDIVIDWYTYYLYHNESQVYVWIWTDSWIKDIAWPFIRSHNTPIRFAHWRWSKWEARYVNLNIKNSRTFDNNNLIINENWIYEDWYIILEVWEWLNIEVWDYITFKNNIFAWATVRVDLYQWGNIYILGINSKWSIPTSWTRIDVYKKIWKIPVIATSQWVHALHVDWDKRCQTTRLIDGDIEDIVNFNEQLFVLKNNVIYFSEQTFEDNLQFYSSSNRKYIEWAYKLVSNWKFLIVFADDNRLVSPIAQTTNNNTNDYSFYPLNYNWRLYSKYSYLFVDNSLYIIQSDKQIMNVNIDSVNATTFNFKLDSVVKTVRWLMSDIDDYYSDDKWFIIANTDYNESKIHFFYQKKDWTTIEYEYDNEFKHWLLHTYNYRIYKKTNRFLCHKHVTNIWGYKDLDKEYKQDINFFIYNNGQILWLWFNDMMMWLIKWEKLEYNFDIEVDSLQALKNKHIEVKYNTFDTLPSDHSLDYMNIASLWRKNQHYWTITSIRRHLRETWRMFRLSINWYKRFIYWSSLISYKEWNPFVHEVENSF